MNNFLSHTRFISTVLSAGLLSMSAANAATHEYLQVPGANGSSTDAGHKNWIDVNSFSWGVSSVQALGGGRSSKPLFQDFQWTQFIDSSTPAIFSDIAIGKRIKNITFDVTETIGSKQQTFFEMTFTNPFITSLSFSGSSGGGTPVLNGSFNYNTVKIEYWPTNADGFLGSGISASYNLSRNQGNLGALAALYGAGLSGGSVSSVAEPGEWALMSSGLGLLGFIATRRQKTTKAA